jgi:hypothetical protein
MTELYLHSPVYLNGIVLNYIITVRFNIGVFRKCYRSWSRHYATSRKLAGYIHDEVIGFFSSRNSSSRTMTLESISL